MITAAEKAAEARFLLSGGVSEALAAERVGVSPGHLRTLLRRHPEHGDAEEANAA